jgi:hypothetical protein
MGDSALETQFMSRKNAAPGRDCECVILLLAVTEMQIRHFHQSDATGKCLSFFVAVRSMKVK